MQQEQFMSQVLSAPENYSPLHVLSAVAMGRWLNVSRISIAYTIFRESCQSHRTITCVHKHYLRHIYYKNI